MALDNILACSGSLWTWPPDIREWPRLLQTTWATFRGVCSIFRSSRADTIHLAGELLSGIHLGYLVVDRAQRAPVCLPGSAHASHHYHIIVVVYLSGFWSLPIRTAFVYKIRGLQVPCLRSRLP